MSKCARCSKEMQSKEMWFHATDNPQIRTIWAKRTLGDGLDMQTAPNQHVCHLAIAHNYINIQQSKGREKSNNCVWKLLVLLFHESLLTLVTIYNFFTASLSKYEIEKA